MSIFFLHPIYLYGLLAAALPLLIHLLNRRRLKRIRFPAVRFVLLSQKRISRSYRLRHWLLLALRTAAVMLLALLLANPIFQIGSGLFAAGHQVALVVILDNSLSMTWSGDGSGFARAKQAARLLIDALGEGDRAAVVPTVFGANERFRLKDEKAVLMRDLNAIEISDGASNFAAALTAAYELLQQPAGQKEIRLITDMALTGWDQFSSGAVKSYDPSVPVRVIRVGRKQQPLNGTIKEVRLASPGVGVGLPVTLEAVVTNFSDREIKDLLLQLSIAGQARDQKLISVPPRSDVTVVFETTLTRAGSHQGQIRLKNDDLAGNQVVHFAVEAADSLKVLLIDGDPQTSLVQSETFFLSRALNPGGARESSLFLPTVSIADGLASVSLEPYQVLVLSNVAAIPEAFLPRLEHFLKQGGGLLIFAGDRLQAEPYNSKLLPASAQLREKRTTGEGRTEKIDKVDVSHPALKPLADPILLESVKSARVWGYYRMPAAGNSALITLGNGDPLLVEHRVGQGRVLVLATSADRDWTDLPLKTAYLPLVQSLASYLAGGKRGAFDSGISVGAPKTMPLPPTYVGKTIRVFKPNKQPIEAVAVSARNGVEAVFQDHDRAGIYRVALAPMPESELRAPLLYAVNAPFLESRLEEIGERELRAKLHPIPSEVVPVEALEKGGKRVDLSLPLLLVLIATLLMESWIAQRV
ncbi:MAG TPA: BatA domain-containing protein [Candidatus Eisenbacteria bacterium]|nr:BatA domain-containing protein [Candidatus Eisenbacteria bacterium]